MIWQQWLEYFSVRNSSSEIEEIEENRTLMILYYIYCNVIKIRNDFFTRSNNVWIDLRKRKDKFALEVD